MKYIILFAFFMTSLAFAAKEKSRKIGNSYYFLCQVEREASDKLFKKEYHFPFPMDKGEQYEIKASQRWNKLSIVFHQDGKVVLKIAEQIGDEMVTATKTHKLGKEPHFESFKVQVDVKKGEKVIPYLVNCGPE